MKTTDSVTNRPKDWVEPPSDPKEKNYGWHKVTPFRLHLLDIKRPKARCKCKRMASVMSANHTTPQELWYACRHCCHTFYRTNEGARL